MNTNTRNNHTVEILYDKMISETEGDGASYIILRKNKEFIIPKKLGYHKKNTNIICVSNITAIRLGLI